MADLIGSTPVSCDPRDTDKYRRTVAVCRKSAEDLNGWMVAQGQAVAYRRYSMDYVNAEMAAKIIKRGIWAGTFQQPEERRRAKREGSAEARQEPTRTGGCAIKGNTSRKGEKVFHVPGSRDYDRTRISVKGGERMFCSETRRRRPGGGRREGSAHHILKVAARRARNRDRLYVVPPPSWTDRLKPSPAHAAAGFLSPPLPLHRVAQ